jgi:putative PIN family toxin of toxin-antitoxin system
MSRPKPRVLVDTNILISGLVFPKGNEHKILKLAESGKIVLILPESVLQEAKIVLARSFHGHEELLNTFLSRIEHSVVPWGELRRHLPVCERKVRDKKDAPLLASLIATKPDFTITGDVVLREDLKQCSEAIVTKICSSTQFLGAVSRTLLRPAVKHSRFN